MLIGFNRPDLIQDNLERILSVNPRKIYIAIDGPRKGREKDIANVQKVREVAKSIQTSAEVHYLFHNKNMGCAGNITCAIDWVLSNEEYVVVVEDDVMTSYSFFRFMQDMLIKYKSDDRIATVSGCNYHQMKLPNDEDYCFAQTGHIWGWATWKRTWFKFSMNIDITNESISLENLERVSASKEIAKSRRNYYLKLKLKNFSKIDSWAILYNYFTMINGYLAIVPRQHLTSNVGTVGAHSIGVVSDSHFKKIAEDFIVKVHPKEVEWNKDYDILQYKYQGNPTLMERVRYKLRKWKRK